MNKTMSNTPGTNTRYMIAHDLVAAVKSDTEDLPKSGFIFVLGSAGNVKFTTMKGTTHTLNFEAREIIPLVVRKIYTTGTTATDVHVLIP